MDSARDERSSSSSLKEKLRAIETLEFSSSSKLRSSLSLRENDVCALVPKEWYDSCLSYLREETTVKPTPMDNSCLVASESSSSSSVDEEEDDAMEEKDEIQVFGALMPKLKPNLKENVDYAVLREETAETLTRWFGMVRNDATIVTAGEDDEDACRKKKSKTEMTAHVLRRCVGESGGVVDNNDGVASPRKFTRHGGGVNA